MRWPTLYLTALVANLTTLHAQIYAGTSGPIATDGSLTYLPLVVPTNDTLSLDTMDFGLEAVCLDIAHAWIGDLDIWLVAPDGTAVQLITSVGFDGDAFSGTCLHMQASPWIPFGTPPYTGDHRPLGQLGRVNNGQSMQGTWWLRIEDTDPDQDNGDVLAWSLTFGPDPASWRPFTHSTLPILIISTPDAHVPDEPKVDGTLAVIDNGPGIMNHISDPPTAYLGPVGIERRGHSSQDQPKRPYAIELRDQQGQDSSVALLGMPPEADWVLDAVYLDKSALRNAFSHALMRGLGHYSPRSRPVELVLDGEHQGVYQLTEKVEQGPHRVDISGLSPTDTFGIALTGGYLFKVDRQDDPPMPSWTSAHPPPYASGSQEVRFLVEDPGDPHPAQLQYIADHVSVFEDLLSGPEYHLPFTGYARYLDVPSFVDHFLITELSRNVDGYRRSTFLHKQRQGQGGRIVAGPLWDMDLAWGNADFCGGTDIAGWAHEFGVLCPEDRRLPPFWWQRLLQDAAFRDSVRCRWDALRLDLLSDQGLADLLAQLAAPLSAAMETNFDRWPTLGYAIWPEPQPAPTTWQGELDELLSWTWQRASWMDLHLPATISGCAPLPDAVDSLFAYPNPFSDRFTIQLATLQGTHLDLRIGDALGRTVHRRTWTATYDGAHRFEIDLTGQAAGAYLVHLLAADRQFSTVVLKE